MSNPTSAPAQTAKLEVTRDEAELLLDGLRILLNSKRFAFKEASDDTRQMHADAYAAVARLEEFVRTNFGRG
jgi:hypothetical protein